ncbi:DEAD/DEAH box helicase [Paenibacillus sp. CAU 1782]
MQQSWSVRDVRALCGEDGYWRGLSYVAEGKAILTGRSLVPEQYRVEIGGGRKYRVSITRLTNGAFEPECSCLASAGGPPYCKHIAAALLLLADFSGEEHRDGLEDHSFEKGGPVHKSPQDKFEPDQSESNRSKSIYSNRGKSYLRGGNDRQAVDDMLGIFTGKPSGADELMPEERSGIVRDDRELLHITPLLQLVPHGPGRHCIRLELKVSAKRTYIVHQLLPFLAAVTTGHSYSFTERFCYDPELHRFAPSDDVLLRKLNAIFAAEQSYRAILLDNREQSGLASEQERAMLVPPYAWDELLPLLQNTGRLLLEAFAATGGKREEPQRFGNPAYSELKRLPLVFRLDRSDDNNGEYELQAEGLREAFVLDAYGTALCGGVFYRLSRSRLEQLYKLKLLMEAADFSGDVKQTVSISPEQGNDFMQKVVPGLASLGKVEIGEEVSSRLWYQPLKARMYLDRVRGKLLAGLEFQYGGIVINPLQEGGAQRGSDLIIMRDNEKEGRILKLMEQDSFGRTEGGFIIEGDDAEYDFLYSIVPRLEQELELFATSAVKLRIAPETIMPKVQLAWEEKTDWLHFSFKLDGISNDEIRDVIEAVAEKRRYYKLPGGALLPLETEAFQALLRVMNGVGLHQPALFQEGFTHGIKLPISKALGLMEADGNSGAVSMNKQLRELLDNLRHPDHLDFPLPEGLQTDLRSYQKYGYQWMKTLAFYGFGGILADEMGLGKTVQSIAFLLSVLPEIREKGEPALIVAPSSLIYNWRNELSKFAPGLRVTLADGTSKERADYLSKLAEVKNEAALEPVDVIITSYPLLRRDGLKYAGQSFHTLILDEAQMFKNDYTQTAKAVRGLTAQHAFALTGTPIENRLDELWSIFRAVFPGLFPDKEQFGELTRAAIAKRSRPFLLRRLKSDVLRELPEKIESVQTSQLLPEQKKIYAAYLAKLRQDTLKHLDSDDFGKLRIRLLAGITRLRQICCHPSLFVEGYQGDSAKFRQLLELLAECRSAGKRVLIFSQFTSMLKLIGKELAYQNQPYFYLDGGTPPAERVELCSRFNDGENDLFLLSLKAGGTGLNLTGADTVILYDLWWNPAVEQQAADRAHRIGQRKVVQIIRMVAEGTVEDKMVELQERKRNLIDEVIEPGNEALSSLTEQELRELLAL